MEANHGLCSEVSLGPWPVGDVRSRGVMGVCIVEGVLPLWLLFNVEVDIGDNVLLDDIDEVLEEEVAADGGPA